MAKLNLAQIEYLSQELIDHLRNAHNLMGRGKFELDLAQRALKALLNAQDRWIREDELDSENA